MRNLPCRFHKAPFAFLGVTSLLFLGAPLHTRAASPNTPAQEEDASRGQIAAFNRFLAGHQEIAVELHNKPWLASNYNYLQDHPDLRSYIDAHPGLRDSIADNPVAFMQEDAQSSQLADFSHFLNTHRGIYDQIKKDPANAVNYNFLQSHPELREYLNSHPDVRQALNDNPTNFVQEEEGFDRHIGDRNYGQRGDNGRGPATTNNSGRDRDADRDRDANASNRDVDRDRDNYASNRDNDARGGDVDRDRGANGRNAAEFDRFLDSHREIAEQVRKDPSLANNREFVQNHPALQSFLQNNPGVRDEIRRDPNAFMNQEARFDRAEDRGQRDSMNDHMADFGGFLGQHKQIARDLSKDPDKVKDQKFVQNRPDLDSYLTAHPDVRSDLMANPQHFVKGAQQMSASGTTGAGTSGSGSGNETGTAGAAGTTGSGSKTQTGTTGSSTPPPTPKTKN